MNDFKIKVYVKLENDIIIGINSSIFLHDHTDWVEIDEGMGDKYAHAQSQYLEKGLMDESGRYNYKWCDSLIELTDEEKDALYPAPIPQPTFEELQTDINIEFDYRLSMLELGI